MSATRTHTAAHWLVWQNEAIKRGNRIELLEGMIEKYRQTHPDLLPPLQRDLAHELAEQQYARRQAITLQSKAAQS